MCIYMCVTYTCFQSGHQSTRAPFARATACSRPYRRNSDDCTSGGSTCCSCRICNTNPRGRRRSPNRALAHNTGPESAHTLPPVSSNHRLPKRWGGEQWGSSAPEGEGGAGRQSSGRTHVGGRVCGCLLVAKAADRPVVVAALRARPIS